MPRGDIDTMLRVKRTRTPDCVFSTLCYHEQCSSSVDHLLPWSARPTRICRPSSVFVDTFFPPADVDTYDKLAVNPVDDTASRALSRSRCKVARLLNEKLDETQGIMCVHTLLELERPHAGRKNQQGPGAGAGQYWVGGRVRSEGKGELRRDALGVSSETVRKERGDCKPCAKKECPKCVLTRGME